MVKASYKKGSAVEMEAHTSKARRAGKTLKAVVAEVTEAHVLYDVEWLGRHTASVSYFESKLVKVV